MNQLNATKDGRVRAVISSALWSAAGDALGWITELARAPSGVHRRAGVSSVTEPVAWQRVVGGRAGPKVDLPAGTYSDDTQLRLAVCRAIRGNGSFDVEAFAKIELSVWPAYALGGGLGTKAAALNIGRRGVNWFSNFFDIDGQQYSRGGGNGAAMRIQPHVWSARSRRELLVDVLKDALVTHGHPQGFGGALFHALFLSETLRGQAIPPLKSWADLIIVFDEVSDIILSEPQLAAFWLPTWEATFGQRLVDALASASKDARHDINLVVAILERQDRAPYHDVLAELGCLTAQFRGAGFKTALASSALAYIYRDRPIESALVAAANELESDTDTIATMAGAILGGLSKALPNWPIQDAEYIVEEARRLADISHGVPQPSFNYPDVAHWVPPPSQSAAIGKVGEGLAIIGLGMLTACGDEYRAGDSIWQWYRLPFGQTIFGKRRARLQGQVPSDQLPGPRQGPRKDPASSLGATKSAEGQGRLPLERDGLPPVVQKGAISGDWNLVDEATEEAIRTKFDDATLGRLLNQVIESSQSIDMAIGFAAIVAKAKLARRRRGN